MTRREFEGRTELSRAGVHRLSDAEALWRSGKEHFHCAKYLAGYAVECRLKAVAMEVFASWTLTELAETMEVGENEVFQHGLEALASHLPFYDKMKRASVWRDFVDVNRWRPSWRYSSQRATRDEARAFLDAAIRVRHWLDANKA